MRFKGLFVGFLLFGLGVLALTPVVQAAQSVGVYPTRVTIDDAARGGQYFRNIGVLTRGASSESTFTLEPSGDIAEWITFVRTDQRDVTVEQVTVPPDSRGEVLMKIQLPEDTANGTYTGTVRVTTGASGSDSDDDDGSSGTSLNIGAELSITVDVTGDQNVEGQLLSVSARDVEAGTPARLKTRVENLGNVKINPEINVQVFNESGEVVRTRTVPAGAAYPGERTELDVTIDTTGLPAGEYRGQVEVRFGSKNLGTKETTFSVLPRGTLTSNGELMEAEVSEDLSAGEMARVVARFHNTGEIDINAKITGEVHKDGSLVDVLSGDEKLVPVGEVGQLTAFSRLQEAGDYTFQIVVNYGGKETRQMDIPVSVITAAEKAGAGAQSTGDDSSLQDQITQQTGVPWFLIAAGAVVGGGLLSVGLFFMRRKLDGSASA
ncbi:MAG: hypothetical protein ACOC5M_03700 [Chloroflexota bacterium]